MNEEQITQLLDYVDTAVSQAHPGWSGSIFRREQRQLLEKSLKTKTSDDENDPVLKAFLVAMGAHDSGKL
jgi:hypothetical protein